MIEEYNVYTDIMKKHFKKELVMTKEDDKENSNKCWICDNAYVDAEVKVRDHRLITEKYRSLLCT